MNKAFVMIHGSWHGGWSCQRVVRQLSLRGHRAEAPTLPGHGPGAMRRGIAHQDCVRSVASYIQQQRLKEVVLVGHSFGGSAIQKVAEEIPRLIERTVFVDALIVEDGHCVFDELPANTLRCSMVWPHEFGQHHDDPRFKNEDPRRPTLFPA